MQNPILSAAKILTAIFSVALAPQAFGVANYVYHERTVNDPGCGGSPYVTILNPSSAQAYNLRFKVEYQFFTDSLRVYYTTDGSAPSGSKGVPSGTTAVALGSYACTFGTDPIVDVCSATIPAQPAGTVVKYIIGAWHSGGGDEIFANSGACGGCGNFNDSSLATVFQYTVGSITELYWDGNGATAGAGTAPTGTWGTDNFWSTVFDGTAATGAWVPGRTAVFSAGTDAIGGFTVAVSGTQTATGVTVEEEGTSFSGGTISLSSPAILNIMAPGFTTMGSAIAGSAGWTKMGDGQLQLTANSTATGTRTIEGGSVIIDSALRIPNNGNVTLNGGVLQQINPGNAGSFLQASTALIIGPNGGTVNYESSGAGVVTIYAGTITGPGNTLRKNGPNEFRYQGTGLPNTTYGKLLVTRGLFRLGSANSVADERGFGAVPAEFMPDQITLNGGSIGVSFTTTLHPNRGITLGTSGGQFQLAANLTVPGAISGPGRLTLSNSGSAALTLSGANTYGGPTFVNSSTLRVGAAGAIPDTSSVTLVGTLDLQAFDETVAAVNLNGGTINGSGTLTGTAYNFQSGTANAPLAGSAALTKTGTGTATLPAANTYSGGTTINAGTLRVSNTTGSGTGTGPVTIGTGGVLRGAGSIAGDVTVNGTISPGASPGTQTTGPQTWNGGGSYLWEMNDVDAAAGADPGWDLIAITGGLTIAATAENKFNIKITSLTLANAAGNVHDFSNGSDYLWTILQTTTGISGFDPAAFNLDTTAFTNALGSGIFLIETANGGNDLVLRFVRAPSITAAPVGGSAECGSTFNFSVTASGSEPLTYQWKHAGTNLSAANASTLSVTGSAETAGAYIVEVSNPYGTTTSSPAALVVEDTAAPNIVCAPNQTVECGTAWEFTAPTASDVCSGMNVTITELSTATNTVAGGYTVTRTWEAKDQANLTATCSQTFTVLDATAPTIACPGNISTCTEANSAVVIFTVTSSDTCDSSVSLVCTPASGSDFPIGTNTVDCVATDDAGNTNACSFTVTVLQNTTAFGPNDSTICSGNSMTLSTTASGTGPLTYQWRKGETELVNETNSSYTIAAATAIDAGTYVVEVTGACNSVTNSAALTVVELASATGPNNASACAGSTVTLSTTASGGGPFIYQWRKDSEALLDETNSSYTISGAMVGHSGNYCVEVTGSCNSVTNCAAVTINPLPVVSVNSMTICSGQSAILTATHNAASPSFLWSNGETTESITVSPVSTTTYSVTVTDGTTTCSAGASGTVTVNPTPMVSVNSATICTGNSATLTATTDASNASYLWSPGGEIGPSIIVSPSSSTTYTVTVTDGTTTCSGSASGTVTVNPNPTVSVNSATICTGSSATLTATTDASNASYLWSPGNETGPSILVGPGSTTTYSVTVTDGTTTCSASASATVTVNPLPNVSVNSTTICAGNSTTLTATSDASNPSYLWSPGNETGPSIMVSPTSTTTYSVTVTDGTTTCSAGASGTITVNPLPNVSVNSATICAGESATLTATSDASNASYAWSPGGETGPSIVVSPTSTATYNVTVTDGTTTCSASVSGTVTVNPLPDVSVNSPTICAGDSAVLTATTLAANPSYLWSPGGEITASITVSPASTTTYACTVTDGSTTCSSSGSGTITVRGFDSFANSGAIAINDAAAGSPYPSAITVSGLERTVCRVTVSLNGLSHAFPDDIDIALVGPNGEAVLLMSDVGDANAISGVNLTFDDSAASTLPDAAQIVSGAFQPSNIGAKSDNRPDNFPTPAPTSRYSTNLSVFNGINPNGVWNLFVLDDELVDAGQIAGGWSLSISTLNPIADLGVSQMDIPDPVAVGSNLTYTIVVTNHGPAQASDVLVTDAPPSGATLVSFSSSQGSCFLASGTIYCSLGTLGTGIDENWATVTVVVTPTATGTLVNTASVTAQEVDFDSSNNSSTSSTTVLNPPVITTGPQSQVVCADTTVTFTVVATGDPPLSYQWYFGIDALPGANSDSLTLPNAQPAASGGYAVVVNNSVGATSASASLTVNPLPTVSVTSATICVGASATLTAENNASNPSYLWSPGGQTSQSIIVSPMTTTTYSVLVTDGTTSCTNSASATVTVNQLTTASSLTSVSDACPGTTVRFSTTAGGTGPHSYVWRKDGVALANTTDTLAISSIALGDAGTYCVEVTGACNSVTQCATLTVVAPPTISSQPQSISRPMGNSASFSVTAIGVQPITYQWLVNGSPIAGETGTTLNLANLTLAQNGNQYSVIVSNCGGAVTSAPATLTVTPIAGISFDFDTPGQFVNTPYNVQVNDWLHQILPSVVVEVPLGHPLSTGALDVQGATDNSSIMQSLSYDFSQDGKTLVASVMVRIVAPSQNNRATQIGFITATNGYVGNAPGITPTGITDPSTNGFMTVILQSTAQPALTYQLQLQHRRIDGGIATLTPAPTPQATLTAGNWYKLVARFQNITATAANTFAVSASLQDMGNNGATPGNVLMSYSPTNIVNTSIVQQRNLHLVIRTARSDTGADHWDNIHASANSGPVYFVGQPLSQTVAQGGQATFHALVDGEGPYSYQWNKNNSPITGARNWKYRTPPTRAGENGDRYTVTVTGPDGTMITSDPATLTVQADPLSVVSVGSVDGTIVGVQFNQSVDRATAENGANYLINGTPPQCAVVYSSTVDPNPTRVLLTPSSALSGPYTVTVNNVLDLSGNAIGVNNAANGRIEGLAGVDINPLVAGPVGQNYSFGAGRFEVTAGGTDIFTAPDSFRYVYTEKTGDFDVVARVPYQDVQRSSTKAGFDVRLSLDPAAPHVLAAVNPRWPARGLYEGTFRQAWNVGGSSWGAAGTAVQYPNGWVRLRRTGNTFLRYSSQNGTSWQLDGQVSPSPAFPDTVLFGLGVCSVANGFAQTASFDNYGDFAGYPGATITITTQPIGAATVNAGSSTNLSVAATVAGAPSTELTYVWQRHAGGGVWTNVGTAGQTNTTFNTGALFAPDDGAEYRVVVKVPGAADVISSTTTVTVTDTVAPTITSAVIPPGSTFQIVVTFSEPMSENALVTQYYRVTNAAGAEIVVSFASFLSTDRRVVVLTTFSPLVAGTYTLYASEQEDLEDSTLAPTVRTLVQHGNAPQFGPVVVEFFGSLTNGGNIGDLTNNVSSGPPGTKFAFDTPDFVTYSNVFGINPLNANFPDTLNNYGVQMYAYFVPATTAAYRFYVRGDDFVQFLMNTNPPGSSVASTNPIGAVLQIAITANTQIYSRTNCVTNNLVAGQRYYMELRFKETTGGDGSTVAVRTDNTVPGQGEVLSGAQLAFPDAIAKPTPVAVELYLNQVTVNSALPNDIGAAFASGGYPDLLASLHTPAFIARTPNVIGNARYFGFNTNLNQINATFDNYLGRMYGNFVAPSNGLYKFYVRSDDSAQLWMNTNAVNSTDPAGMTLIGVVTDFYDANQRLVAQNVYLNGGQRYYMEGRWRDGGTGDGMTVTFRAQSDPARPATTEVLPGSRLEFPEAYDRVGPVDATLAPINPVVSAGETISFQGADVRGAPAYGVTWFKNGVLVGANTFNYITQPLTASDNGAVFTMVVTNPFSRIERSSTVTVLADNAAPTILAAVGSQYQDIVVLTFSELLDVATASSPLNYQVNNGIRVFSASPDMTTRRRVTLRTSPQTPGTTYTVTVNGVRDAASNVIAADTAVAYTAWIAGGSGLYVEVFTNIAGTAVGNLTGDPKYINNVPDVAYYTNRLGAGWFGNDTGLNNYGVRLTSLFSPPTNGLYRFYIRGDDGTQIFMNTNGPDVSGRVLIARNDAANSGTWENGVGGSFSPILTLNANTLYFTEVFMKEGGGQDHLEVMLRAIDPATLTIYGPLPGPSVNDIVPGDFFVAIGNPDQAQLTVTQTPEAEITVAQNDTVTLAARAHAPNFELSQATGYRWQVADGIGGFANVAGGLGRTLTFIAPASDTEYRVVIGGPGTNVTYSTIVHSSADTKAPFMILASSLNGTNIDVVFNEPLEVTSAQDAYGYTVNEGVPAVLGAVLRDDPRKVTLTLEGPVSGTFTLAASGVYDLAGQADFSIVTGTVSSGFMPFDVNSPTAGGSTFAAAADEFDVVAGGNDIWDTADRGHLTLKPVTGDFDVHLRVAGLTRPDAIAKAGLMVRESLLANSRTLHQLVNPAQYQAPHPLNPTGLTGRDLGEAGQRPITTAATAAWQARPESIGLPSLLGNSGFAPVGIPNAWIRIKREGNLFSAYHGYDGVNWRLNAQARFVHSYAPTVYLGLATTAHTLNQAVGLVTVANYRDVYIPPAPIILVQPAPSVQTVPLHATVSYSVVASNPPPNRTALRYQWFRSGSPIPNATGDSITIADAQPGDAGVYTVEINNDGGTTTSAPVTLNVDSGLVANTDSISTVQNTTVSVDAATLLANDSAASGDTASIVAVSGLFPRTFVTDFNDGVLPPGMTLFGAAGGGFYDVAGGVNNSGVVKLTMNVNNHAGALLVNDLVPGRRVSGFSASFMLRIGDGSAEPADGFSFNFAPDLPDVASTANGENGVGSGFSFGVDNYRFHPWPITPEGFPNTSGLKIRYRGVDVAGVRTATWNSPRFVPVSISVTPEGRVTVFVDGTNVFGNLTLPNYIPMQGRFGMYARNGGQNMSQWLDNLSITSLLTVETTREPNPNLPRIFGNAYVSGGLLHLTDNVISRQGSYIATNVLGGSAAQSFTAAFKLRIGGGSATAADGFSFNFANNLPLGSFGEEGAGSGLTISFDSFNNGGGEAPAFDMKWGGAILASVFTPISQGPTGTRMIDVQVTMDADGTVDLSYDGTNVFSNVQTPFTPMLGRFGVGARTGSLNDNHWLDDLVITANTAGGTVSITEDFSTLPPAIYGTVVLSGGAINYTPPTDACGSDTFYYLLSGQYGGLSLGRVDVNITEGTPIPPVITVCATNRTLAAGLNCLAALPDMTAEIVSTDNCCCPAIAQNPPPGSLLPRGTHTVTFTATDSVGLTAQCQATVTVIDQTPPVITLVGSGPLIVECHTTSELPGATAADDCDGDLTSAIVVGGSVDRNVPGTYILTYNVSDSSGNPAIQVERFVNVADTTAPSITCPGNIVTPCTSLEGAMVTYSVEVADSCDANATAACSPPSGTVFAVGTHTVTCTASDATGNRTTCSFTVTVQGGGVPVLSIVRVDSDTIRISWPRTCQPYRIEQSSSIGPDVHWTPVSVEPSLEDGNYVLSLTVEAGNRFFRLTAWSAAMSAGSHHSLLIKRSATLWTWGEGNGGSTQTLRGPYTGLFTQVAGGDLHSLALHVTGAVWGWGDADSGQLGISGNQSDPVPVLGGAYTKIAAGAAGSLALRLDGALFHAGVTAFVPPVADLSWVQVGTQADWSDVAVGGQYACNYVSPCPPTDCGAVTHSLALKRDGSLWAWGENTYGQLGLASPDDQTSPVRVGTETTWSAISAGEGHSFALQRDGSLWAWGWNAHGQLGDGGTSNQNAPLRIGTANNWKAIAAGFRHSVALQTDGSLWAWGCNGSGQLGDGSLASATSPIRIGTDTDWVAIAAGAQHTLAVKADGSLWAWGDNGLGQLGDSTTSDKTAPIRIGSTH
jgi:uncharacterized repeat protein (TIGR01451 family)